MSMEAESHHRTSVELPEAETIVIELREVNKSRESVDGD